MIPRPATPCYLLIVPLLLAQAALAGGVRIVDAPGLGSLPDIQSAVDAAVDGDTLLVAPGTYAGFVIDGKSLNVLATVEGSALVDGTIEVVNLGWKGTVLIAGLDATGARVAPRSDPGLRLSNNDGHVRLQRCSFSGGRGLPETQFNFGDGGPAAELSDSGRVAFAECTLQGGDGYGILSGNYETAGGDGGAGARTPGSAVAFYDCQVLGGGGGHAGTYGGLGGAGCEVPDFGIFASGTTFRGGTGGTAWDFLAAEGGDGGDGLHVEAIAQAQLVDNDLSGGPGGPSLVSAEYYGQAGAATSGGGIFKFHGGAARTFQAAYLSSEGEPLTIAVDGSPGDLIFLATAVEPAWFVPSPKTGIWLVPKPGYFQWPPLAVLPPSGAKNVKIPTAGVGGTQGDRSFFFQGYALEPAGGGRLGSPLHLVLLNRQAPPDCDGSGVNDYVEMLEGLLADCDDDLDPDICAIAAGTQPDCNGNLVPDSCDLSLGTSTDCNANGVPDECEGLPDCNRNGVPDVCDILNGTSPDANGNGIPDECEVSGVTWYCDPAAAPGGNGSLASPFDRINDAVSAALSGDTVLLLDGVYTGAGNQNIPFQSKELVLRSQNGPSACIIDFGGFSGMKIFGGQTAATRIEGLTLTNAFRAIDVFDSDPVISNCVISDCFVTNLGAGIMLFDSEGRVEDCLFLRNSTSLSSSIFAAGGGMYVTSGSPVITRCLFEDNASRRGGGLAVDGPTPVIVSHCVFKGNSAETGGGVHDGSYGPASLMRLNLDNCLFYANDALQGAGIFVDGIDFGGGSVPLKVTNCTLADNAAAGDGGGLFAENRCDILIANCVLWGNTALGGAQIALDGAETKLTVSHSDVGGGLAGLLVTGGSPVTWGAGNIDADPVFVAPGAGNYRLGAGSPCIDAGANAAVPHDLSDVDGDGNLTEPVPLDLDLTPRFVDDPATPDTGTGSPPLVDLGPYEGP